MKGREKPACMHACIASVAHQQPHAAAGHTSGAVSKGPSRMTQAQASHDHFAKIKLMPRYIAAQYHSARRTCCMHAELVLAMMQPWAALHAP